MSAPTEVQTPVAAKLSQARFDALCEERERLKLRIEEINQQLSEQVEAHGFTPPRAEKSKRLLGAEWQATVSYGDATEIRDAQVEVMKRTCPAELFGQLFREVKQYRLAAGASMLLAGTLPAGAPPNLRKMFSQAVVMKPKAPSLRIERIKREEGMDVIP